MIKRFIRKGLDKISGGKTLQSFWERLHEVSLTGMNFGAMDIKTDGERGVLKRVFERNNAPIVFDIGANKGDYSLEVVSLFGDKTKLYSFEPSKETFSILSRNLSDYKNIKLYNFGFGDREEMVDFYSSGGSGLNSVFLKEPARLIERVEIKRLDDFCRDNNINHIDLLKVDAEGSEWNILKGAKSLIDFGSIDFIQFEFGGFDIEAKVFFRDFFNLLNPKYRIYRILKNGLALIDKYNEKGEIFRAINYLAILKTYDKKTY